MRHDPYSSNPAIAAIVAVLALSPLPAVAQLAEPASSPDATVPTAPPAVDPALVPVLPVPETAAPPAASAAPAPRVVIGAPQPVVQPVSEKDVAAPVSEPAAPPAPARKAEAPAADRSTRAALPGPSTREAALPATPSPSDVDGASAAQEGPVAPPAADVVVSPSQDIVPAAATAPAATDATDNLATAGGLGLAALAAAVGLYVTRRRRRTVTGEDKTAEPLELDAKAVAMPMPAVTVPQQRRTVETSWPRPSDRADIWQWREEMVAQPPSLENPFLTRRNRLRRANFLLRQAVEQAGEKAAAMSLPKVAGTRETRRPQPTISYSFAR